MEATKEEGSLLSTIRPPRLEDAGLEDCALSHDSIKEAFFKAANSIRSWAGTDTTDTDSDDPCIETKTSLPNHGGLSDSLIGINPPDETPASCSNEKGGGVPDVLGDEVCVGGDEDLNSDKGCDQLLGSNASSEGGKCCVEGLQGLKIEGDDDDDEGVEDEEEDDKPILVEGYV